MKLFHILLLVIGVGLAGCGDGGGGREPEPVNVEGKWAGEMDHTINGVLRHYGITLVLFQDGAHVTGGMILESDTDGHGGHIDGMMTGNHFKGTRTARHIVDIEFDVEGDTLVGTFTFVSPEENLDEHGTFTCNREPVPLPAQPGS
jgi:hypothetical protein